MSKKFRKTALPIAGAILGSLALPGIGTELGLSLGSAGGAAIGGGLGTLASGGGIKNALLSGAGSYLGGNLAQGILGGSLGTVGGATGLSSAGALPWSAANTGLGQSLGNVIGSSAANSLAAAPLSGILGSFYGSDLAQNALGDQQAPKFTGPAGPAPFVPKQADAAKLPAGLSGFASLTPQQQSTNIANQGVYGGGNGPEEQGYFTNLINRRLVDLSGNLSDKSTLAPIEQSYLSQLGLGGYGDTKSLLEAISKWKAA